MMKLRGYQTRIVAECIARNAIVVLPTGAGKTLIAAEVIRRLEGRKLFLVPTIMLVEQQAAAVRSWAPRCEVGEYFGGERLPSRFDLLISTPKAFEIAQARDESLAWGRFSLVVFDEVHHVLKDHPYRKLAVKLRRDANPPRVLGLTASLSYAIGDAKVEASVRKLCDELQVQHLARATSAELRGDGYHAGERAADVRTSATRSCPSSSSGVSAVETRKPHLMLSSFWARVDGKTATAFSLALVRCIALMEAAVPGFESPLRTRSLRDWGAVAHRSDDPAARQLEHWYDALKALVVSWEEADDLAVTLLRMSGADVLSVELWPASVRAQVAQFVDGLPRSFPRFEELKEVLVERLEVRGDSFRGIVFVEQRVMAHVLDYVIRCDPALGPRLQPVFIYATSSPATASLSVSKQQAADRLAAFAQGESRLLIATAVAEEGMDVPKANASICFDYVQHAVQMVQRRGRARQDGSDFIVLSERHDRPVSVLAQAEQRQHDIIQNFQPTLTRGPADEAAAQQAQASRERGASAVLARTATTLETLGLYCKKTKVVLAETFDTNAHSKPPPFRCTLVYESVLRTVTARGEAATKKAAKLAAATSLIALLAAEVS